jgi:hypothetical protein
MAISLRQSRIILLTLAVVLAAGLLVFYVLSIFFERQEVQQEQAQSFFDTSYIPSGTTPVDTLEPFSVPNDSLTERIPLGFVTVNATQPEIPPLFKSLNLILQNWIL